ncbi:MAG TPA: hypothetical protein VHE35_20205 [Kofleriaceae bacterium]|nr:hypothetical protein [Kofleriaceae bacterium]
MRGRRWAALAILLAAGCGDGGDDGGGPAPGDTVGSIELEEADLGGQLGGTATVYASFEAPGQADVANDGTCRVYPWPCLGQVGACATPPQYSAGAITIAGLAVPLTLRPDPSSHFYASPAGLPDDLFADGATITATAAGDQVDAFSLTTGGVAPLVSPYVGATLGLTPGQPYALTWTAGGGDARIQLEVNWADICHAGAAWYVLVCETDDTGAFTVPAAITAALPADGFSQCGARLARVRRATVPGRDVSLIVASSDYFGFF